MLGMKPVIGIPAQFSEERRDYRTKFCYIDALVLAGGIPILLPACNCPESIDLLLPSIDGILLPGGADVDPFLYGEEPRRELGLVQTRNDLFEIHFLQEARAAHKPIFCICRGIQVLNVAFGGTLYQDIPSQLPESLRHYQTPTDRKEPTHTVDIVKGSYLYEAYGEERIRVNSFHHQAIKDVAEGFTVSARSRDGLVEAIEARQEHILGVQWHPEELYQSLPEHFALFTQLVEAAREGAGFV